MSTKRTCHLCGTPAIASDGIVTALFRCGEWIRTSSLSLLVFKVLSLSSSTTCVQDDEEKKKPLIYSLVVLLFFLLPYSLLYHQNTRQVPCCPIYARRKARKKLLRRSNRIRKGKLKANLQANLPSQTLMQSSWQLRHLLLAKQRRRSHNGTKKSNITTKNIRKRLLTATYWN